MAKQTPKPKPANNKTTPKPDKTGFAQGSNAYKKPAGGRNRPNTNNPKQK